MLKISDLIMKTMDLGTVQNKKIRPVQLDEYLQDWDLLLSNNTTSKISTIVKNGPLLLIFIRGTWCPFCRLHMKRLREWVSKLKNKKATIIVVSTEPIDIIKEWLKSHSFPYLFASDERLILSDHFGVRLEPNQFSQAATFLIDTDLSVRLAYVGKRDSKNFEEMDNALDKMN
jgi:peroxiredoxin